MISRSSLAGLVALLATMLMAPAAYATTYASDTFTRTVSLGTNWGTADVGGTWSEFSTACASGNKYSADGTQGLMDAAAAANRCQKLDVSQTDVELAASVKTPSTPTGGAAYGYIAARATNDTNKNRYQLRVEFLTDGTAKCRLQKVVSGTTTQIGSPGTDQTIANYATGDKVYLKLRVEGTAVNGACQADTAPATWTFTATDSSITTGTNIATRITTATGLTNSGLSLYFDDLTAVSTVEAPADLTFTPTDDSYVDASEATTAHGSSTILKNYDATKKHIYLRFDTGAINTAVDGGTINSAKIRLYGWTASGAVTSNLHRVDDTAWSESTIKYTQTPARPSIWSTALVSFPTFAASGYIEAEVPLSTFTTMLAETTDPTGMTFAVKTTTGADERTYSSKEGSFSPQLVLDVTPADTEHVIAAVGDMGSASQSSTSGDDHTDDLVNDVNPEALQLTGDLAYPNGSWLDFWNNYDGALFTGSHLTDGGYGPFGGLGGSLGAAGIVKPAPGNHEYHRTCQDPTTEVEVEVTGTTPCSGDDVLVGDMGSCYFQYMNGLDNTATGTPGENGQACDPETTGPANPTGNVDGSGNPVGYYSYDVGTWHIVVANSSNGFCTGAKVPCNSGSTQYTWLANDLASTTASCIAMVWHHPRYTAGHYSDADDFDGIQPLWDLAYDNGVDVVLNGHDHQYQRLAPMSKTGTLDSAGPRTFIIGSGGQALYTDWLGAGANDSNGDGVWVDTTDLNHLDYGQNYAHGILKLVLDAGSYTWAFIDEATGTEAHTTHHNSPPVGAPAVFTDTSTSSCQNTH